MDKDRIKSIMIAIVCVMFAGATIAFTYVGRPDAGFCFAILTLASLSALINV